MTTYGIARLVLMSVCMLSAKAGWAQIATGSIAGAVKDTTGAVLPGVTVEASSPALIEKVRTVVTDDRGEYKIVELRPGTYTVTFSLPGFSTVKRAGIELTTGFTAAANAELQVGTQAETVTVTGASPVVDIQDVRTENVLTRNVIDAVPIGKNFGGYSALTLGTVVSTSSGARDVGGNSSEFGGGMSIHGSRTDGLFSFDGLPSDSLLNSGTTRRIVINQADVQEIVLQTSAMSAEIPTSGVTANVVPKDGGNTFGGVFNADYSGPRLESNNVTSALRARGVNNPNVNKALYDINGGLGGPIVRDRLWFYEANRRGDAQQALAATYFNALQGTLFYAPDLSKSAYTDSPTREFYNVRLTWQISPKNKIAMTGSDTNECLCFLSVGPTRAPEASWSGYFPEKRFQATWTYTATNRLLFEAAGVWRDDSENNIRAPDVTTNDRSVVEQSTGMTYGSFVSGDNPPLYNISGWLNDYGQDISHYYSTRGTMSYVTGSHAFKTGFTTLSGFQNYGPGIPNFPVQYTFLNQKPVGLTELAAPGFSETRVRVNLGVFAQDQWTLKKLTLNLGLRFDYLSVDSPAQTRPAGTFTPAFQVGEVPCQPCWKDISPRVGAAYDPRGDGKTALKVSVGKYVVGQATQVAQQTNPANAIVGTVTRPWNDANSNYVPDCNLQNPLTNGECGPVSNLAFGTPVSNTHFDPSVLTGWNTRPHNWQLMASVQRELVPGVSVTAGYYRTWYANFFVTDNTAVTSANYSPYCIAAPVDPRLTGGGGYPLCGLYNISPSNVGQVYNLVTNASNFGKLTDIYNGMDLSMNARFGTGGVLFGGVSLGHEVTNDCALAGLPNLVVNTTFSANFNTGSTAFCQITIPNNQLKFAGSYPLPWWGLQVSGNFQNLPGIPDAVSYVATNAQIAPSLGRNLGQCGTSATCNSTVVISSLIPPNSMLEPRQNQTDLRLAKPFQIGRFKVKGTLDVYNVFNANSIQILNTTYGSTWRNGSSILSGRFLKFGTQLTF